MKNLCANFTKKMLISVLSISLLCGMIALPTSNYALASTGGVDLPSDSFNNDDYSDADFYPFYAKLNDNQKRIYKILVEGIENLEEVVNFATEEDGKALNTEDFTEVVHAIYYEHPEFYWFGTIESETVGYTHDSPGYYLKDESGNYILDDNGNKISMYTGAKPIYNKYADDIATTKANFNSIVSEILDPTEGMSQGEKAYYIHNEVCKRVYYDESGIISGDLDATVYGTLTKGKAVCQGYARTLQYLFEKAGIPTNLVFGQACSENNVIYDSSTGKLISGEPHAWVVAKIDGNFYNIDVTWDDNYDQKESDLDNSFICYNYFIIQDSYIVDKLVNISDYEASVYSEAFKYTHDRDDEFDFLPAATVEPDFESLVGVSRKQAFIDNYDATSIDGIVTDEQSYKNIDMQSVFEGSFGDVSYTVDESGNVTGVSGSKATFGQEVYDAASGGGYASQIDWSNVKYLLEPTAKTFIVTDNALFNNIRNDVYRNELASTYVPNLMLSGRLSFVRTAHYYMYQNDCYVYTMSPCILSTTTKSYTTKATVVDWAERQGVFEVEEGSALDLSGTKVNVFYNSLTSKQVDASTLTVTGFDSSKLGYQDITLTYTGDSNMFVNTLSLRVNVKEKEVEPTYTLGDVNADGQINSDDAIRVLMYTQFPSDASYALNQKSDFNGDGQVNSDDAIRLLMHCQFPDDENYVLIDS